MHTLHKHCSSVVRKKKKKKLEGSELDRGPIKLMTRQSSILFRSSADVHRVDGPFRTLETFDIIWRVRSELKG